MLAQFPKIPNWYLIMIQANIHTYMINIWRADSGGRLWNWSPVDYLVTFCFLMKPVLITFILQNDWIKVVGYAMAMLIFSNDFTHLQLLLSVGIPFLFSIFLHPYPCPLPCSSIFFIFYFLSTLSGINKVNNQKYSQTFTWSLYSVFVFDNTHVE